MFGTLFIKECRQILKSLVFYIYLVIFAVFITGQMSEADWVSELEEPQPGQEYYGYGDSDSESVLMETGLEQLFIEIYRGRFLTYPYGFAKEVRLNEGELAELTGILEDCTGLNMQRLEELYYEYWSASEGQSSNYEEYVRWEMGWHIPVRQGLSYSDFEEAMEQADRIVGKGSMYGGQYQHYAKEPLSYEDAVQKYLDLCEKDGVTGAQMRLFCDYAGIVLAFLPIFAGVSACLRDRRAKAAEVIYSKRISSFALIGSRYLANAFMFFVPVAIWAFLLQMPCAYAAAGKGIAADELAFLKYSVLWLLPLIMVMLSAAFLITEATGTILAVPVLFVWGVGSLFSTASLTGDFGWKLIVRWNEFGGYSRYVGEVGQLYLNRGFYAALGVFGIVLTIIVFEKKRRQGEQLYGKIRKGRR